MGEVWRAEHLALHSPVAIKLIDPRSASNEVAVRRFMQEARAAAALQSPHVVRTTDFGVVEGTPYIVMELLTGESLAQRLQRQRRLTPEETARVIRHVARAVGKAHLAGFVHRDLKPDNIFIVVNDDEELVKVLDFGIAKAISGTFGNEEAKTRTGALLGTPYYMSPEQAQGDRSVDFRSDLWSLGIIAFECLTGVRPFDSEGLGSLVMQICVGPIPVPSQLAPVPQGFDEWFAHAVNRDPEGRFQSARELSHALLSVLAPVDYEGTGVSRVQWPAPSALGPDARPNAYQSISAVTPMPNLTSSAASAQTDQSAPRVLPPTVNMPSATDDPSSPYAAPNLAHTTGAAAAGEIEIPMRGGAVGWLVAVGVVALVVGLGATVLVVRAVAKKSSPAPGVEPSALVEATAPSAGPSAVLPAPPPPGGSAEPGAPSAVPSKPAVNRPQPAKTGEPVTAQPNPAASQPKGTVKPTPTSSGKGRLGF